MNLRTTHFQYKARYFVQGNIKTAKEIWFVLHGHGQLAQYFLRKFDLLDKAEFCLIAPEGLSHYYLKGYSGRVGATWMTKEDRLTDIENYVNYLDALYCSIMNDTQPALEVTALGFSQGTATVARWAGQSTVKFDRLVLWSGIFPPDMPKTDARHRFENMEVITIYGDNDPFLKKDDQKEQQSIIDQLGIKHPTVITFSGNHDIDSEALKKLANREY